MIELQEPGALLLHDETLACLREGVAPWGQTNYVDGKPVKRLPMLFQVDCNVQPLSSEELLLVPEGDRFKSQYNVFAVAAPVALQVNDKVLRQGIVYQVQDANLWGAHVEARMMAVDVGPDLVAQFAAVRPLC